MFHFGKEFVLHCPKAEFKGGRLINLREEIPRELNIQVVTKVLLVAFSQICSDNY